MTFLLVVTDLPLITTFFFFKFLSHMQIKPSCVAFDSLYTKVPLSSVMQSKEGASRTGYLTAFFKFLSHMQIKLSCVAFDSLYTKVPLSSVMQSKEGASRTGYYW